MDFALPHVGEGLHEVELVRWLVAPGDAVARGQSLMEVMSDKATMEVTATFAGTVSETLAAPGSRVKVGQRVLSYTGGETNGEVNSTPIASGILTPTANGHPVSVAVASPVLSVPSSIAAAPSVRHLARKLGVDLGTVRGSGPGGRILLDDLATFLKPTASDKTAKPERKDALKLEIGQPGTRQKLIGLRRKIAERMVESTRNIPHYSYIDECEVSELVQTRTQLRDTFDEVGIRLTYLPFFVKAVARALKEVPVVNSTFDDATGEITMHDRYHIGIAVAAPNGLIVPVVKDADKKDIAAIATEIERLSNEARSGKSKLDDIRGGTFTITSVGNIGGLISTPIINPPEVGIMGIGRFVKRPIYDDAGNIRPADLVYLSFSFDHRILDGAIGAMFGNAVIKQLRRPAALLLPERFGG